MTRWYRAYVGTVSDPKIAGAAHRAGEPRCAVIAVWHFILERAAEVNEGGKFKMDGHQICATLDLKMEQVKAIWASLIEAEMVTDNQVLAWKKRQYETDVTDPTNAERQRRFKEKRFGNGKVTEEKRPDTDTDTEKKDITPDKKREIEKEFLEFYAAYPKKVAKQDAAKAYTAARREVSHTTIMDGLAQAIKSDSRFREAKFTPYPASWLRDGCYDDEGSRPAVIDPNRFKALPGSPEFLAWKAYFKDGNQPVLTRELNQRELECRAFSFESQWPPGHKREVA